MFRALFAKDFLKVVLVVILEESLKHVEKIQVLSGCSAPLFVNVIDLSVASSK